MGQTVLLSLPWRPVCDHRPTRALPTAGSRVTAREAGGARLGLGPPAPSAQPQSPGRSGLHVTSRRGWRSRVRPQPCSALKPVVTVGSRAQTLTFLTGPGPAQGHHEVGPGPPAGTRSPRLIRLHCSLGVAVPSSQMRRPRPGVWTGFPGARLLRTRLWSSWAVPLPSPQMLWVPHARPGTQRQLLGGGGSALCPTLITALGRKQLC